MNSSNRQQQGAGFRSGPIRNVGGGPPSLNTVNRPSSSAAAGHNSRSSSSAARPTAAPMTAAPPITAPRYSHDAQPVQQSYNGPFSQQQNATNLNTSHANVATANKLYTPDNSAQLQPHIAQLPPPPPQQSTAAPSPAFHHPLDSSSLPSDPHNPAAELQRRFYPQHYNNTNQQQQQQNVAAPSNQPVTTATSSVYQQQSNMSTTSYQVKTPPHMASTTTTTTTTQQAPPPPQLQTRHTPIQRTKPPPTQPDDEDLDNFLSIGLTDSASGISYTRPKPLPLNPNQGVLSKSKLLASRRAWGDVIRVTNDALIVRNMDGGGGSDVGKHHSFYSEIVSCASVVTTDAAAGETTSSSASTSHASSPNEIEEIQKLRRETCELIVLRFIAHLKLRRYVDLGKEVMMLGLLPFLPDKSGVVGGAENNNTSIDVDVNNVENNNINNSDDNPLSWKEGSIHTTEPKDKLPSWIPYGLRILAAQQLQYNDGSSKALDVLLDMRDRVVRTEYWNTPTMKIWKSTIDNAIVNVCIRMKEWRLALYYLEEMIAELDEGVEREVLWYCRQDSVAGSIGGETRSQLRELITSAANVELLSRQILILLQSGAVNAAELVQEEVRGHAAKVEGIGLTGVLSRIHEDFALVRQAPIRVMVNDGLILFAQSDYELAATRFRDAIELQESVAVDNNDASAGYPLSWKDLDSPTLGFDAEPSLTVECINNLSLCLLYSGKMRAAVHEMESLIRKDPCENLTEGMAFNLCTLYELGSDGEECSRRKKRLQRVAKRFFLHDIGAESFRLS